jgi:GH35 family endo-1,4-beta-xylanase
MVLLIVTGICVGGFGVSSAQDNTYTLRELADLNNFHIGAAVYTTHLSSDIHVDTLSREFNMLTPEQEAKHCEVERQQGQFTFQRFDKLVAFAQEHDMMIHGHALVWHQCTPDWVTSSDFTREQAIQALHDSIFTIVGRYKGRVPIWDVVNEGIADGGGGLRDTQWRQVIGDDYIELAFQFAHEADPDALLFYNDYGAEGGGSKSDAVYEMVKDFVERGIPINGVGLQSHFTVGTINTGAIADNIKRLGELGLQVEITEMDDRYPGEATPDILRKQAADYHNLLQTCLDSGYCTAFITWGVTDKYTWLRGANLGFYENPAVEPLMFDDDYQPKPAYFAVQDVLARKAGVESPMTDAEVDTMLGVKTSNVEIPAPTKTDPDQLAPDSVPGQVYYAAFPATITLDGETDDWANIPRVTVDNGPMLPSDNDTSLTFAVAADETNLYFLADVKDSKLAYGTHDPASEWYQEDSVEFYLNTTGDLKLTSYEPGVAQIGILAANITKPDAPLIGGGNSADSDVKVTAVETADGYRIEAAVPLTTKVWSIEPKHLGVLGFQVHLNGASADTRDTKLIWSAADTGDQSWQNPSLFGQLIFWDVNE